MQGIIRGIDPQRRIVIPKETLMAAGLEAGDLVEVFSDADTVGRPIVSLVRYTPGCCLCGEKTTAVEYSGRKFCEHCILELHSKGGATT